MNNKRRIFSALFSLFLLLGTVPAWAVSSIAIGLHPGSILLDRRSSTCRLAPLLFVTSVGSAVRTPTQGAKGPRVG